MPFGGSFAAVNVIGVLFALVFAALPVGCRGRRAAVRTAEAQEEERCGSHKDRSHKHGHQGKEPPPSSPPAAMAVISPAVCSVFDASPAACTLRVATRFTTAMVWPL